MPTKHKWKQQQWARAHYDKNKAAIKDRARKFSSEARRRNKEYLRDHLIKNPCIDCGESDPDVLDFDHVRGTKVCEVTTLAHQPTSMANLVAEVAKCEVRCVKCHRKITKRRSESVATEIEYDGQAKLF